jgi:hypothetical protein
VEKTLFSTFQERVLFATKHRPIGAAERLALLFCDREVLVRSGSHSDEYEDESLLGTAPCRLSPSPAVLADRLCFLLSLKRDPR